MENCKSIATLVNITSKTQKPINTRRKRRHEKYLFSRSGWMFDACDGLHKVGHIVCYGKSFKACFQPSS